MEKRRLIAGLFLLSGATGLLYEIIWIRLLALSFGSTAQALSTVSAVYLGGLAVGAFLARWLLQKSRWSGLRWYGVAEIAAGVYAVTIPSLIGWGTPWLGSIYASGGPVLLIRALLCAMVIGPGTILMGASLPFLASWAGRDGTSTLYAINLAGATLGTLLCGFSLLPALGFTGTLALACAINVGVGVVAFTQGNAPAIGEAAPVVKDAKGVAPALNSWGAMAFLSGFLFLLYEVTWSRVGGLLFGPTTSTVTLVLAAFLAGLAISAWYARRIQQNIADWLCGAQLLSGLLLFWTYQATRLSPHLFGEWVTTHVDQPGQVEWMKLALLGVTIVPLAAASGLVFPLLLRMAPAGSYGRYAGGVYGINTAGCIVGSLLTGWVLIPYLGTQETVLVGGLLSAAVGLWLLKLVRPAWFTRGAAAVALAVGIALLAPRWNMELLTAGGYKYAPYGSAESLIEGGQLVYLREGTAGTVVVRKRGGFTILAIDGKVDASDAGGDLLTEKLLAHLPLRLTSGVKHVGLIGLASGVTAGAVLTYPVDQLDVLEVSPEVVEASHFFDAANGKPLSDPRTKLLLNDGRNHLELTSETYDLIISEPSNPWIAGMNSLFTRDFFEIARARLRPGGLLAQWFHIYNMPNDDLRSLLRAFHEVFPRAALWRLNDGDVLLTGWNGSDPWPSVSPLPEAARADLKKAGVDDPELLWSMFVMRDADIGRFAADAPVNTDDHPWLEFHGQRNLHTQTDSKNADELEAFAHSVPDPSVVASAREGRSFEQFLVSARTFERAESYRSAYRNFAAAFRLKADSMDALAGMDRCARQPFEHQAVKLALGLPSSLPDTLQARTEHALTLAQNGDIARARRIFTENVAAHPNDPAPLYNFGVFSLEQNEFAQAVALFEQTIQLDSTNVKAHEAMAEAYLKVRDYPAAAKWSRRILELDPNHAAARQIVDTIERSVKN